MGLEFCSAVLGSGDPAVELLDGRLPVSDPVPLGASHTPRSRLGDAAPPMSLAPGDVGEVHPTLGVLALAARLVNRPPKRPLTGFWTFRYPAEDDVGGVARRPGSGAGASRRP
jgi:hypothetical protein